MTVRISAAVSAAMPRESTSPGRAIWSGQPAGRPAAHRRFSEWTQAWVWAKLHRLVLDEIGARGELDWSRCAIDSVNTRNTRSAKGGS
jgi:hypothetical protein